jgi:16S rRNA (guanine966-N2)-methyltransferase
MRIIGGLLRGRKLEGPATPEKDPSIRPTSDKVRGAIFNVLLHSRFPQFPLHEEASVADIFCGTGALGLEALSRGAASATFVDHSRDALALVTLNAAKLGARDQCRFLQTDAHKLPRAEKPFDVLFLDPPYRDENIEKVLASLLDQGWVKEASVIVVESARKQKPVVVAGLQLHSQRPYGDTCVSFYIPL